MNKIIKLVKELKNNSEGYTRALLLNTSENDFAIKIESDEETKIAYGFISYEEEIVNNYKYQIYHVTTDAFIEDTVYDFGKNIRIFIENYGKEYKNGNKTIYVKGDDFPFGSVSFNNKLSDINIYADGLLDFNTVRECNIYLDSYRIIEKYSFIMYNVNDIEILKTMARSNNVYCNLLVFNLNIYNAGEKDYPNKFLNDLDALSSLNFKADKVIITVIFDYLINTNNYYNYMKWYLKHKNRFETIFLLKDIMYKKYKKDNFKYKFYRYDDVERYGYNILLNDKFEIK